jgi:hypothetical protein
MKSKILLLLALLAPVIAAAADGQFSGVSTKGNLSVWRVNHGNGSVSLCGFEGHKNEPVCYPWSVGGNAGNYQIIGGDDVLSTWRINASNGSVSLCEYKEVTDPPICTPWSGQ